MTKVAVIGLGYIGLPTACLIAGKKIKVIGVDINPKIINLINQGKAHITEPDLAGLLREVVDESYLEARIKPDYADVFIICVPTPFKDGYKPDTSFVEMAITSIIPYLKDNNLIVIESTCPVGTTEKIKDLIFSVVPALRGNIYIAYCPERVLPGKMLYELTHNDRIIGGIDEASSRKAKVFYSLFVKGDIYITNAKTAEMCKLAENAYRDANIAFANELSLICDKLEIDVYELIDLANKHPRVSILQPGCGVGGHCVAIDPWFIVNKTPDLVRLIKTAREVNLYKAQWVIKKIMGKAKVFQEENKRKPLIAILGLAYKPDVNDLRESPALKIAKNLAENGCCLYLIEPNISNLPEVLSVYENVKKADLQKIDKADIIVFLVAHKEFNEIDKALLNKKIVVDTTGILSCSRLL